MTRPLGELETVTDCVEEVLFTITAHASISGLIQTSRDEHPGDQLYSRIEAIILRAQEVPRPAGASGSRPLT